MTAYIESACDTCNFSDICIIHNKYDFLTIAKCGKKDMSNIMIPHAKTAIASVPTRDKNFDLKQLYEAPKKLVGKCESCGMDIADLVKCEVCGKQICETCAIVDAGSGKTMCQDCYEEI